ncbi:MAG: hypothetical protein MJZ16_07985 [Bacteroidales bacterium]|nr:hypothetical protein [Bacteroidales bacterium]
MASIDKSIKVKLDITNLGKLCADVDKAAKLAAKKVATYASNYLSDEMDQVLKYYYNDGFVPHSYHRQNILLTKGYGRFVQKNSNGFIVTGGVYRTPERMNYVDHPKNFDPEEMVLDSFESSYHGWYTPIFNNFDVQVRLISRVDRLRRELVSYKGEELIAQAFRESGSGFFN